MPVTPSTFKEEYSEFSEAPDPLVQAKLEEAYLRVGTQWGDLRDAGVKKLAAHLLWISPMTEPSDRSSPSDTESDYLKEFNRLLGEVRGAFFGAVADGNGCP